MRDWRKTAALTRAAVVGAVGVALAVALGSPALACLVGPFAAYVVLAAAHRPTGRPEVSAQLAHATLTEGQGTTTTVRLEGAGAAEVASRVLGGAPHVAMEPWAGAVAALVEGDGPAAPVRLSPRRWGRHDLGEERFALFAPWAGFRWGPVPVSCAPVQALPTSAPFDSAAEAPQPVGLVGAHRSRRPGSGTELAGIRPFQVGDGLRRIHWRSSLRGRALHVVATRAEEDAAVLLVVDALADHGRSGGVDGAASSLDVTLRAAAALAEHHVHTGDRVAVRVLGPGDIWVPYGSGVRHLRRILTALATIQPGPPARLAATAPLRTVAGTVVLVLTPMLHEVPLATAAAQQVRGLPVLVVDTLPGELSPGALPTVPPEVVAAAWRMRVLERDRLRERLVARGVPVVAWRGPGTLDEVLRRLARRAQLPQVVRR